MTNVRGYGPRANRKDVISQKEVDQMLKKADQLTPEYFRLRAKALLSLFKPGKRRGEVASLAMDDIEAQENFLYVTYTVEKKRKKDIMSLRRRKRFHVKSRHAQYIMAYWDWMKQYHPKSKWLFPSGHNVFGVAYVFDFSHHLHGRQLLRIIQSLNPKAWCHLFRETRGAEIVKKDEDVRGEASIETVYRVRRGLDLESEASAWRYIRRYATETIEDEDEIIT
jgi:integrase